MSFNKFYADIVILIILDPPSMFHKTLTLSREIITEKKDACALFARPVLYYQLHSLILILLRLINARSFFRSQRDIMEYRGDCTVQKSCVNNFIATFALYLRGFFKSETCVKIISAHAIDYQWKYTKFSLQISKQRQREMEGV